MNFFQQTRLQQHALFAVQKALEYAVLYPGSKTGQRAVHAGTPPVIGDVIAHHVEHTFVATSLIALSHLTPTGGYRGISPVIHFPKSLTCSSLQTWYIVR